MSIATKIEFDMLIVVILYEFHTSHFAVYIYYNRLYEVLDLTVAGN